MPKKYKNGLIRRSGKKGSRKYSLLVGEGEEQIIIKDIPEAFKNPNFNTWTRILSMTLRHGLPIQHCCEQVAKAEDFNSFLRIITRILKKYVEDGAGAGEICECGNKMTYVQGCLCCMICQKSRCS